MDAQRAFVAYVKWVFLMKNKDIFNVKSLDLEKFAHSLGLVVTPRVRFLKGKEKISVSNINKESHNSQNSSDESETESETETETEQAPGVSSKNLFDNKNSDDNDDDDNDILTVKRRDHEIDIEAPDFIEDKISSKKAKVTTKVALAKKMLKKKIVPNKKVLFDEGGETLSSKYAEKLSKEGKEYENENAGGIDIEKAKKVLKAEDKFDKKLFREKVKDKHKTKKIKLKKENKNNEPELKDDFGTDSESSGPDVSWLPDPDKVYSKTELSDDESDPNNSSEEFENCSEIDLSE